MILGAGEAGPAQVDVSVKRRRGIVVHTECLFVFLAAQSHRATFDHHRLEVLNAARTHRVLRDGDRVRVLRIEIGPARRRALKGNEREKQVVEIVE